MVKKVTIYHDAEGTAFESRKEAEISDARIALRDKIQAAIDAESRDAMDVAEIGNCIEVALDALYTDNPAMLLDLYRGVRPVKKRKPKSQPVQEAA